MRKVLMLEVVRRQRGLSQTELAALAGLTQPLISQLERGLVPSAHHVESLTKALKLKSGTRLFQPVEAD